MHCGAMCFLSDELSELYTRHCDVLIRCVYTALLCNELRRFDVIASAHAHDDTRSLTEAHTSVCLGSQRILYGDDTEPGVRLRGGTKLGQLLDGAGRIAADTGCE